MVTAQPAAPKPRAVNDDDFTPARLADDLLERIGDLFAGCKIDRTARGDLAVSPPNARGGSPE